MLNKSYRVSRKNIQKKQINTAYLNSGGTIFLQHWGDNINME